MTEINDLTSYFYHDFNEDSDNSTYKVFENKYLEYLQQLAKSNNWEIKNTFRNDFNFSICIKSNNKVLVVSISDVRKEPFIWYDRVFIKLLTMDKNYKHTNYQYYTELPKLAKKVNSLTNNKIGVDIDINDIF